MRGVPDILTLGLARTLARVFYREVEVQGAERVPAGGPVLFVANHGNSLVDPLLLIALLPRRVRFLAKSTLWRNPVVMPLLRLSGAIPVYRRQDGTDTARNRDTFSRCHEELAQGAAVALFPEGISHHASELQPLKTGAARIVLGAERDRGPLGVRVVPVGLTFEDKGRFRSRALLVVGEPLDPAPELARAEEDEREAVRALTLRIEDGLRRVTLNFASWQVSDVVERAVDVLSEQERTLPGRPALAQRFSLRRAFGERYAAAREKEPERVERIEHMALRYDGMLAALSLRDDQVTARYPFRHALAWVTDRIPVLLLGLPVALVGTLLNYLPYRIPGWVAWIVERHGDLPATYKILTGLLVTPLFWALEVWAAAAAWGAWGGVAMAVIAPASGWLALLYHERNGSMWREILAYLTLRWRPQRAAELRALRRAIRDEVEALIAQVGA